MLELRKVEAAYGDIAVLFDVSFDLAPGEAVTLLGRNGAGKSTTLKAIVNLVTVIGGTISFEGRNLARLPTNEIAHLGIGYVPEERRIFSTMTVEENLRVTRPFRSGHAPWTLSRVYEVFPKLAELRNRAAGLLSGGEQQMLCIARTLMGGPKLLLLDEPSEGLAPVIVEVLQQQIGYLKQSGMTILLAEQNVRFAEAVSDRVVVIDRGVVEFQASFEELHRDEARKHRHLFTGSLPKPAEEAVSA